MCHERSSWHIPRGTGRVCFLPASAIQRLVAKVLCACLKVTFTDVFQKSRPRGQSSQQFGANLKNVTQHMIHLIACVLHHAPVSTDDDPVAIVSRLDVKNVLRTLSRTYLSKTFMRIQAVDVTNIPVSCKGRLNIFSS